MVAWFVYRRSVTYDMPPGEVHGPMESIPGTAGQSAALAFHQAGTPQPSTLSWVGGIPVVRLYGDAHAFGAAHGRLLAPLLPAVLRATVPSIERTVDEDGWTHRIRLGWRWRFVDDGYSEQDRRMIAGLARGAAASHVDVAYTDLVRAQALLDVGEPSARSGDAELHAIAHSLAIVAQQAQTPSRVWIGRVFALPGLDDGGTAEGPVVTIAHPDGRIAWAGVGWPGALGCVTGINAEGIAVIVNPARTGDVRTTRSARPVALLGRAVLEQAKTLDEAIKLIEGTPTLGSAVFVLVDGASGRFVQVERTPSKAILEKVPKSPAIGDVLTTNALASDPENDRARRLLPTIARTERAAKLAKAPLADVTALAQILRDTHAPDDSPRPYGHRGAIDDGRSVHVAIIDPASLSLWVADPASGGRMRAFDLRHELRGEGDRPLPPSDIPADASADPERVSLLASALADLREARGALTAGDRDAAAEAAARAIAKLPALPEALELTGVIAQARGNTAAAQAAFAAWLDGGPDDPKGEERARAAR
ncbi:MAG TPA: C45 family autoproteolytic acyltransferase/hydrolase [Kofleriaceae bacterium]